VRITLLLLLSFLFYVSCKPKATKEASPRNNEKRRVIKLKQFSFNATDENNFETFDEFKTGYIEEFEIDEVDFRLLLKSDTSKLFDLESKKGGIWKTNLNLPLNLEDYYLTRDFDKDGIFDLELVSLGNVAIYLYDEPSKSFLSVPLMVPFDCVLLDEERVIYGSNNKMGNVWDVEIFTIVNKQKYFFFKAQINTVMESYYRMINSTVYKCKNGNLADTVLFKKEDLQKDMMLNRYMKELMGIKL
jgi:hypothetical protein